MQAIIEAAKLARAAKLVDRAKVGGSLPILKGTRISANGHGLEVAATNLPR